MIKTLIEYGVKTGLISDYDRNYIKNRLLEELGETKEDSLTVISEQNLQIHEILKFYTDFAIDKGAIEDNITEKILFETKIMGALCPRPSEIIRSFQNDYKESPQKATDNFYRYSMVSNYIRTNDVAKDIKWKYKSEYGEMDITINLSKPEKDPRAIAQAKTMSEKKYPQCMLCPENEGYMGRIDYPPRQNLRMIPMKINNNNWYMQYSPYVYYNEHCIVLKNEHIPMKISRETFENLLDFEEKFPHYFIGSNADLPIVGGSILAHEHYQGGRYIFAMEKAQPEYKFTVKGYENVDCYTVKWPMSVIRITGKNKTEVIDLCEHIFNKWADYSDETADILSETTEKHNTVTPIARRVGANFQMDLVLRNNRTTPKYPLGIFHPHESLHHIKKENIGLIEVMGLAVLPGRLKKEFDQIKKILINGSKVEKDSPISAHAHWVEELRSKYSLFTEENADEILKSETGRVFVKVLEDAGVYKRTEAGRQMFIKFINTL